MKLRNHICVVVGFGALASCAGTRHLQESEHVATVHVDSTVVKDTVKTSFKDISKSTSSHIEHDSVGYVGGGNADLSLSKVELQPVTDAAGETQGRTFRKDNGHEHAAVTVNKDGSIDVDCNSDSLLMVVQRQVRDSISNASLIDSLVTNSAIVNHSEIKDSTDVERVVLEKKQGFVARAIETVKGLLALWGIVCLVILIVRHLIKKFTV